MKELITILVGLEITEIMAKNKILERVASAETVEEKTEVVNESIALVHAFASDLFKDTPEAQAAKEDFMQGFRKFQFEHFGLPVPQ